MKGDDVLGGSDNGLLVMGEIVGVAVFIAGQFVGGWAEIAQMPSSMKRIEELTRAYTPGLLIFAQPSPNETIPTIVSHLSKSGPPESPLQESLPNAAAHIMDSLSIADS